jgi:hypothetical protein
LSMGCGLVGWLWGGGEDGKKQWRGKHKASLPWREHQQRTRMEISREKLERLSLENAFDLTKTFRGA